MKRIRRILSLLLSIILLCSIMTVESSASEIAEETQEEPVAYFLSVDQGEHMKITVSGQNVPISEMEENVYSVISGEALSVAVQIEEGYELEGMYLNGEKLEVKELCTSFLMPEQDTVLSGQTSVTDQDGEESLKAKEDIIGDKKEGEKENAAEILSGEAKELFRGIDISSYQLERTTTRKGTPNVGDKVTGTCYIYDA